MSILKFTPLEHYIKGFLRTQGPRTIGRKYAQKAKALIDEKLGIPCCDDPTATIDLVTRFDNNFTNAVKMLLVSLPKTGNKQSLIRSKALINRYLNCCVPASIAPIFAPQLLINYTYHSFGFTPDSSYPNPESYEYTFDAGATYNQLTGSPWTEYYFSVPNNLGEVIPINTVGVRIKAVGANPPSNTVFATTEFFYTPAAPVYPATVNDVADTFDWTNSPGFPNLSDYEYSIDAGSTYINVTAKPINVGNIASDPSYVRVRVKGIPGVQNPSYIGWSPYPFTVAGTTPAAPTAPVSNLGNRTFSWTGNNSFIAANSYEYTLDSGSTYTTVSGKPITIPAGAYLPGTIGIRVKAYGGNPPSTTLYNTVGFA